MLSELRLTELRQDIALAKDLDFDTIDFDFSSAVFAEQNFVTNSDADCASFATFKQSSRADSSDRTALWFFASGIRQNDSASSFFFSIQWLNNNTIIERVQCHSFITPLWSSSSLRRQRAV